MNIIDRTVVPLAYEQTVQLPMNAAILSVRLFTAKWETDTETLKSEIRATIELYSFAAIGVPLRPRRITMIQSGGAVEQWGIYLGMLCVFGVVYHVFEVF